MEEKGFTINMKLGEGYQFLVSFGEGLEELLMDEPVPLGQGEGPNASRLLAAAVGNCLSASALFCLRKARIDVKGMKTSVTTSLARNEQGRRRIGDINVRIQPRVEEKNRLRMQRCLEIFEDYCIVTQSVRKGINVKVEVA